MSKTIKKELANAFPNDTTNSLYKYKNTLLLF